VLVRSSLPAFAASLAAIEGKPWHPYPHLVFIAARIREATRKPGGGRLIITIPPRNGKSRLVSHYLPTYFLEGAPELHVILASYGDRLAQEWGRKVRDSFAVKDLKTSVRPDVSATTRWETPEGGGMVTAGVGGPILGKGGNLLICDDVHKSWDEAQSPVVRRTVQEWFTGTFMSRAEPDATVVIIQQRLHERDLAGYLMAEQPEEWDVVSLPAIAEQDDPMGRQPGEPLCSARYPLEALERVRANTPPSIWDAMQQQHPRPPGGTIINEEWLKYYEAPPERFDRVILSWDMSFKETTAGSFVVGQVWGRVGADCYLLSQVRRRMDFTETQKALVAQANDWPQAGKKLVEDKANGSAILSSLKSVIPGLTPITPHESKESRCHAISPFFRAGNVHLPRHATWIRDYVSELTAFPGSEHDDQVDATTQALTDLLLGATIPRRTGMIRLPDFPSSSPWSVR